MKSLRQFICGLKGHEHLRIFEPHRVALRCSCGHETPGWTLRSKPSNVVTHPRFAQCANDAA